MTNTTVEDGHEYELKFGHGTLFLGHLPGRKSWCIYVMSLGVIYVIAHVRNDQEAQRLVDAYEGEPVATRADFPEEED
jgi:hypothetical protein